MYHFYTCLICSFSGSEMEYYSQPSEFDRTRIHGHVVDCTSKIWSFSKPFMDSHTNFIKANFRSMTCSTGKTSTQQFISIVSSSILLQMAWCGFVYQCCSPYQVTYTPFTTTHPMENALPNVSKHF